jgi:hypothetical protein
VSFLVGTELADVLGCTEGRASPLEQEDGEIAAAAG